MSCLFVCLSCLLLHQVYELHNNNLCAQHTDRQTTLRVICVGVGHIYATITNQAVHRFASGDVWR